MRRLPARDRRWRRCSPEEASIGAVPVQDAKWALLGNRPLARGVTWAETLGVLRELIQAWDDSNRRWLGENIGPRIAQEYVDSNAGRPLALTPASPKRLTKRMRDLQQALSLRVAYLDTIRERLPLWTVNTEIAGMGMAVESSGSIFVVHGRDEGSAQYVARVLERGTGHDVTILHEQANEGRTVTEKFEHHAQPRSGRGTDDAGGRETIGH
jgi:hypothetical protein